MSMMPSPTTPPSPNPAVGQQGMMPQQPGGMNITLGGRGYAPSVFGRLNNAAKRAPAQPAVTPPAAVPATVQGIQQAAAKMALDGLLTRVARFKEAYGVDLPPGHEGTPAAPLRSSPSSGHGPSASSPNPHLAQSQGAAYAGGPASVAAPTKVAADQGVALLRRAVQMLSTKAAADKRAYLMGNSGPGRSPQPPSGVDALPEGRAAVTGTNTANGLADGRPASRAIPTTAVTPALVKAAIVAPVLPPAPVPPQGAPPAPGPAAGVDPNAGMAPVAGPAPAGDPSMGGGAPPPAGPAGPPMPTGSSPAPGQPPPGQPMPGTSEPVMQQTPMQLQHKRVNLHRVVQQLLRSKQRVPLGPDQAQQELDSNALGLGIKDGAAKCVFGDSPRGRIVNLAKLAARG